MALPMLIGGAECGPSNPLQGLSKRFDQDRGLQQDNFGAGRASSSRDVFRSQQAGVAPAEDAARFFSNASSASEFSAETPYNVHALRAALPMTQMPMTQPLPQQRNLAAWAADFSQHQQILSPTSQHLVHNNIEEAKQDLHYRGDTAIIQQPGVQWNLGLTQFRMNQTPAYAPALHMQQQPVISNKRISWDREFNAQVLSLETSSTMEIEQKQEIYQQTPREQDDLARTAGMLLENIKNEQNPKFQKSQFLGLMKQLRDGEVVVDGNQMVENNGQTSQVDLKGKGRATEPTVLNSGSAHAPISNFAGSAVRDLAALAEAQRQTDDKQDSGEDVNDAYFRQENAEFTHYWNTLHQPTTNADIGPTAETLAWDKLQNDWDHFEATSSGIKPISKYHFQSNNPYLLGDSSRTRHHLMHAETQSVLESVLELEAAVQRDPSNASVWYELGVKQQENEREQKALQALQRAVELDPSHLPSWLALAISYTNDNNRQGTYDAIQEWVDKNENYRDAVQKFQSQVAEPANATIGERFSRLIQCLITMARSDLSGNIDADIQIALAVLLNTNEEYEKAQDCFRTALAVRPEDWLLYNRVGATMANSGRAEEALQYYYRALELNPGYIRARFNLGISCINLRRYEEAAQHILDALVLQDSDGVRDSTGMNDRRGVVSTALWDSLRTTCLYMHRPDLANLCDLKDLEEFRNRFQ